MCAQESPLRVHHSLDRHLQIYSQSISLQNYGLVLCAFFIKNLISDNFVDSCNFNAILVFRRTRHKWVIPCNRHVGEDTDLHKWQQQQILYMHITKCSIRLLIVIIIVKYVVQLQQQPSPLSSLSFLLLFPVPLNRFVHSSCVLCSLDVSIIHCLVYQFGYFIRYYFRFQLFAATSNQTFIPHLDWNCRNSIDMYPIYSRTPNQPINISHYCRM